MGLSAISVKPNITIKTLLKILAKDSNSIFSRALAKEEPKSRMESKVKIIRETRMSHFTSSVFEIKGEMMAVKKIKKIRAENFIVEARGISPLTLFSRQEASLVIKAFMPRSAKMERKAAMERA